MDTDGRKIHPAFENPIDNVIIDIGTAVNIPLRKIGITPNMLTTVSLVLGLLGAWTVYKQSFYLGALLVFMAYFFDCMDGNMARKYDMVTVFGDYYDHIADLVKIAFLLIAVLISPSLPLTFKIGFVIVNMIFAGASSVHLGCQERVYRKRVYHATRTRSRERILENGTLTPMEALCPGNPDDSIRISRYFGTGTFFTILCLSLIIAPCYKS